MEIYWMGIFFNLIWVETLFEFLVINRKCKQNKLSEKKRFQFKKLANIRFTWLCCYFFENAEKKNFDLEK